MDEKEVSEMQEEMMTVLVVEPMKAPYVKSIPNELEDLQQAVGGDIEMTYPFEDEVGILLNGNPFLIHPNKLSLPCFVPRTSD